MSNKKRILLLGYGPAQQRLITNAKQNNYHVIVCSNHPSLEIFDADAVYEIDINDKEQILHIAKNEKIDGISSNKDECMMTVAYVATALGLVGNAPQSVNKLQDKHLFREMQKKIGMFYPEYMIINSIDEIIQKARGFTYPLIIKPCESAGSRGVKRFDSFDEKAMTEAYIKCRNFSRNGKVMIERYIPRLLTNLECDVFIQGETYMWLGYETNFCSPEKPMQPCGGMFPADETEEHKRVFEDGVKKLMREAGISHGIYNIEAFFTEQNELFIIEINARMAGATVPEVIKKQCDIDVYKLLVSTSVKDDSYFLSLLNVDLPCRYITSFELFPYREGIFSGVHIDDEISDYVYDVKIWGELGKRVTKTENSSDSLGKVYLEYPNRLVQKNTLLRLSHLIYPVILKM